MIGSSAICSRHPAFCSPKKCVGYWPKTDPAVGIKCDPGDDRGVIKLNKLNS